MSTQEPEDSDEIFRRLTEDLNIDPVQVGVVTVTSLTDMELLTKFQSARNELHTLKEVVNPVTEKGREAHSVYHACLLELKRRKMA